MSQQINFYNSKLVKPKDWFSLSVVAIVYVIAVGLMVMFYQQLQTEVKQSQQALQLAQSQFDAIQTQLTEVMGAGQNKAKLQEIELQLKSLHDKVASQEKVIKAFTQVQTNRHVHLADYMEALARQRVENVWLTGFKIDAFTNSLTLMGRAFKGELVPQYINHLSLSPVFRGQLFGGLKLTELKQTNEPTSQGGAPIAQQTMPQSIEKSTDKITEKPGQKNMTLIEFEVNGVDVKSKISAPSNVTSDNEKGSTNG